MQLVFENVNGNDTVYLDVLKSICGDTEGKSMVDLGCNHAPHTPKLGFKKKVYVDVLERKLDHEQEQQFFVKDEMISFLTFNNQDYDVIFSLDSIEHLSKDNGYELIRMMKNRTDKPVLFTPLNGWMMDMEGTDPEGHHSLWTPDMLPDFASVVFPVYHPTLNIGAWFGWMCTETHIGKNSGYQKDLTQQDFERVKNELNTKSWAIGKVSLTL